MLSSLINKFVRLCELRHGLSTGTTCTNTNLKRRQQQRSPIRCRNFFNLFLLIFSTPVGCSTHLRSSRTQAKLIQSAGAYPGQPQHEATKTNATPSWMGCRSNTGVGGRGGNGKCEGQGGSSGRFVRMLWGEIHMRAWARLTFPSIDSGEANMLFFETPFKLFPDLLEPPPYNGDTNMHVSI